MSRTCLQRFVFFKQLQVLAELRPELGDSGLILVVSGTQLWRVDHRIQMPHDAPRSTQPFCNPFQRFDKIFPISAGVRCFQLVDQHSCLIEQLSDRRRDIGRTEDIEARQVGKIK